MENTKLSHRLKYQFNLLSDMESEEQILENIRKDAEFKGANLWILILAIVIASIGLNVNSGAVIIGAMLISPLMGPLIAIGVALSIQDFGLIKRAAKNLGFALAASLIASTIYFLLTPLDQPQTEIINRTTPTIFDVFIAFAGGIAGMIATSRKTRGNVLPGVAIATALMPPLCTAGYGLASGNWHYFFGAFYLFFINCVFIFLGTFLVVKFLHFHTSQSVDKFLGLKIQRILTALVVVTILPSCYLAYQMIQNSIKDQKIQNLITQELSTKDLFIVEKKITKKDGKMKITLSAVGPELPEASLKELNTRLPLYGLKDSILSINHIGANAKDLKALKANIMDEFQKTSRTQTSVKDQKIALLEAELQALRKAQLPLTEMKQELKILYPGMNELLVSKVSSDKTTVLLAHTAFLNDLSPVERSRLRNWLKVRTQSDDIRLTIELAPKKISQSKTAKKKP